MQRKLIDSHTFALTDLLLVLLSGAVWMVQPEWGLSIILVALFPWMARLISGRFPFRRTKLDWLIAIFVLTAWVGYWASYDRPAAWSKIWFIMLGVLLFYALSAQPRQSRTGTSYIVFAIGVLVSIYFLLTHDFGEVPRKLAIVNAIGLAIMELRPQVGWAAIHPNYAAGIIAFTVPFIVYPSGKRFQRGDPFSLPYTLLILTGLSIAGFALVMATSRGVVLAIVSGGGAVLLGKFIQTQKSLPGRKTGAFLPAALLVYLCVVITLLYLGPAQSAGGVTGPSYYGNGSRAQLLSRSAYLLTDFPLTGGGLASFPGLFSQYILNIPFFYLPNSHNLFLDVAIEQGVPGGLAFVLLYLLGLWNVSKSIAVHQGVSLFKWIVLFALVAAIVHGMVDNYLYNGIGSIFSLFLVGLSINDSSREVVHACSDARRRSSMTAVVVLLAGLVVFFNPVRSAWYANLGAVQLSKVELSDFPSSSWDTRTHIPHVGMPEAALHSALRLDPDNRTANHRLGLIAMLRGDFASAQGYLEAAWKKAPEHRGIVKSLGYCYTWLGDLDKAHQLLESIPEAKSELEVYIWWWDTQGRSDLSEYASQMVFRLKNAVYQQPE